ncbi:histidine phosphatase family protein [Glacieibacterium frigidum]|uniref:Histidine phosphatase family protein n=1 Tax=Glacieibacterium frigidum TaxID=2593303 RepID=A0A552UA74_9SPHN|nr:histidine phosphatase family protein [Glacieibacterium frigidum]TRW15117.1 histidine phosphatase family protein [Glacieibacterium frigidum]
MRLILARHAETVYNAGARMQGHMAHTPLTRAGIAQAEAMGTFLREHLGQRPDLDFWASPSGRTLQTSAIVAEHLGIDFFDIRTDDRLLEIDVGDWQGRRYADIVAETGPIVCPDRRAFNVVPPNGEYYPAIRARLEAWLAGLDRARDVLVISHGITLRVLRGLLAGGDDFEGVAFADDAPQGTVFEIVDGTQTALHLGGGFSGARAA